jgi:hypothetical protein
VIKLKNISPQNVPKHGTSGHFEKGKNYDKNTFHLPRQEANTSLEMLMFSRKNADWQRNLQKFYRESNNSKKSSAKEKVKKLKNRLIISHNLYIL